MSTKLSNQGLSSKDEFKELIKSIGFKYNSGNDKYEYKELKIDLYNKAYYFLEGYSWIRYDNDDLTPLLKLIRSYKLKKLLG